MGARLPLDKVSEDGIHLKMLWKDKVRVKEVQILLGHLNFAGRVIRMGRNFGRRLGLALTGRSVPTLPHHRVRLSAGVRKDLRMWCKILIGLQWDCHRKCESRGKLGFPGLLGRDRSGRVWSSLPGMLGERADRQQKFGAWL